MSRFLTSVLLLGLLAACDARDPCLRLRFEPSVLDLGRTAATHPSRPKLSLVSEGCGGREVQLRTTDSSGITLAFRTLRPVDADRTPVSLRVDPTGVGPFFASLEARVVGAPSVSATLPISGMAVEESLRVEPSSLDLGGAVVGGDPVRRPLRLSNLTDQEIAFEPASGPEDCAAAGPDSSLCFSFHARAGVVPAGGHLDIQARFTPTQIGPVEDTLVLASCERPECEIRIPMRGEGVARSLDCEPGSIDFGEVVPGRTRTLRLTCRSRLGEQLTILSWTLAGADSPDFEVEPPRVQVLNLGDEVNLEATFAPRSLGAMQATLRIETDLQLPRLRTIELPLLGVGGGSRLEVAPRWVDFGQVSTTAPARRQLTIANRGTSSLEIVDVDLDVARTGAFSSPDLTSFVLAPGASRRLTLEVRASLGTITSSIRVLTPAESFELPVRAEGLALGPCRFAVGPTALGFGPVERGRSLARYLLIENRGTSSCLLTGANVVDGREDFFVEPVFDLNPSIAPGSAIGVPVLFRPTTAGPLAGRLELSLTSSTTPFTTIDLQGEGIETDVFTSPAELDFGTRRQDCSSEARSVRLFNRGSQSVTVSRVRLATSGPAFALGPLPPLPVTLSSGASSSLPVRFTPSAGAQAGALEIEGTEAGVSRTWLVPLYGRGTAVASERDTFVAPGKAKVDILFVVRKAAGTGALRELFLPAARTFVNRLEAQGVDYQLGVTTTDDADEGGRLISAAPGSADASSVAGPPEFRVVTPQTAPTPQAAFITNLQPLLEGQGFATSTGLGAAERALSSPLAYGHNAGFVRPSATLALVFVSDTPDRSDQAPGALQTPQDYLHFYWSVKGFRERDAFSASAIAPGSADCRGPLGSADGRGRYETLARQSGGVYRSVCGTDWSAMLEAIVTRVAGPRRSYRLSQTPRPSSLTVEVDGSPIPREVNGDVRWTYQPEENTLVFSSAYTPELGANVIVSYGTQCP